MGDVVTIDGVSGLVDIAAGSDGSVWGLAKATVSGGQQLLRCIRGSGRHSWERIAGGATNISVGPDGLPWGGELQCQRPAEPRPSPQPPRALVDAARCATLSS